MGTGSFPEGKEAGAWRWPPTPSSAEVKVRVELYLYSPSGPSWPVLYFTVNSRERRMASASLAFLEHSHYHPGPIITKFWRHKSVRSQPSRTATPRNTTSQLLCHIREHTFVFKNKSLSRKIFHWCLQTAVSTACNVRQKVFPVRVIKTYGEQKYSSTESSPRHYMQLSGHSHVPGDLPPDKMPPFPIACEACLAPEIAWALPVTEPRFSGHPDHSLVAILSTLSQLQTSNLKELISERCTR